jgi:hypothetical protein
MAIRPAALSPEQRRRKAERESRIMRTIGAGLVHVVRAGFAAALEGDDSDEDDSDDRRENSHKKPGNKRSGPLRRGPEKRRRR